MRPMNLNVQTGIKQKKKMLDTDIHCGLFFLLRFFSFFESVLVR